MEVVVCYCQKCSLELGKYRNAWNGIGNTYYSPGYGMLSQANGFEASGPIFPGSPGSAIEDRDQLILALLKMNVVVDATGEKAKISVLKSFSLTHDNPRKPSAARRASTAQPVAGRKSISAANSNGILSATGSMLPPQQQSHDLASFKTWAQEAISTQKMDIERVSGALNWIEGEMQAFTDFMKETRAELKKEPTAAQESELGPRNSHKSSSGSCQVRSEDMIQVNDKASQVDDVKVELKKLKNLVNGVEKATAQNITDLQTGQSTSDGIAGLRGELQELRTRLKLFEQTIDSVETEHQKTEMRSNQSMIHSGQEPQTGRRMPRVEIPIKAGEHSEQRRKLSRPKKNAGTIDSPKLVQLFPDNAPGTLKRKHRQMNDSPAVAQEEDEEEPSLLSKRRRVSEKVVQRDVPQTNGNGSDQSHNLLKPQKPNVIEILSSDRGSPMLGEHESPKYPSNTEENGDITLPFSKIPLNDTPSSTSKPPEKRARRASLRKVASVNNLAASITAEPVMEPATEPRNRRRQSDAFDNRRRDPNGLLVTPAGKVDGRSAYLAEQASESAGKRTPSSSKPHSADVSAKNNGSATDNENEIAEGEAVLQSIERDDEEVESETMDKPTPSDYPTPDSVPAATTGTSTPRTAAINKAKKGANTFKCTACSKDCSSLSGLLYHVCPTGDSINEAEQKRREEVEKRERLVKATLEREMG
ncbi:hypothetical protein G7Y89_g1180 [Cudoniella acicularis]|uniref:Uncharacterized protein n=1 Tax=Cudoniella acicularis TaxID=354080 RepID=A0A8H4RXE3_9HELO|nr:hypothetical protein G7Y89_g1180 [Cudoniella acicularis]